MNLFTNAMKFSRTDGMIKIQASDQNEWIRLEVTDSGEGISEGAKEHIFERFYKEDKARTSKKESNGLGLSIAHKIVTLHGGIIKVISEKGEGTSFIVYLPK
ncbi:sensor histidine kinase [Bacillus sp. JCM 19041]|uniref:sensor histidine kinase n=1 Tax=Bacillus sp. JCM 19041 TaxID=1460637 RepID=UPI00336A5ECB